jgi:hypothetical protein
MIAVNVVILFFLSKNNERKTTSVIFLNIESSQNSY